MAMSESILKFKQKFSRSKLSLFCLISDGTLKLCTVDILKTQLVGNLKDLIKQENSSSFINIDASDINLYKAPKAFSDISDLAELVRKEKMLDSFQVLSDVFPDNLDPKCFHVVAMLPSTGRRSALPSSSKTAPHEKPAIENAWKTSFRGSGAKLFQNALDNMNNSRDGKLYANFVPIIQSSGMGKSRLVDESAKLIFTIPFCFRSELNGYPEADEAPRDFFGLRAKDTFDIVFDRSLLFLEKLFTIVRREILEKLPTQVDTPLPVLWYNYLLQDGKETRQRIYNEIVTTTEDSINTKRTLHYSNEAKQDQRPVYIAAKALIDTIKSRTKEDGSEEKPRPVRLLVYIDEAHEMTTQRQTIQDDGRNVYQILCSSLNQLRNLDLFFVFLSTNPGMPSNYSPSSRVSWSARGQGSAITYVQTPYTELPFDVWKEPHLVSEGEHTMDNVCSMAYMVRFGRPLWWTRWEAGDVDVRNKLLEFAMMKLAAQNRRQEYNPKSYLAALSVRLMLDFEPRRISAIENEGLMVAGHLRVANVIPSHREYIISSTPSEPIVAEAAAQILQGQNIVDLLRRNVSSGLIEKGQRGELAARLLLTLAHDAAVSKLDVKRDAYQGQIERLYTTPVPLLTFISALFAEPHIEYIKKALPDNQPSGPTFQESFNDAYVMFTHFGKAADDQCMSDTFAFMALSRNMAIACREMTKYADLCIPIHFGKETPLSRDSTSAIFVSIKDKEKSMGYNQTYIDVSKMKFFTDESKGRPVIKLILQLGIQSAGRYMPIQRTKSQQTPGLLPTSEHTGKEVLHAPSSVSMLRPENTRADAPKTQRQGTTTASPPCYTIEARGCSSNIYGVVRPADEALWHELVASKDFLSEHSRQETCYLEAVLAQKPIWTHGSECCSWAKLKGPNLQFPEQEVLVSEGVFLGTPSG